MMGDKFDEQAETLLKSFPRVLPPNRKEVEAVAAALREDGEIIERQRDCINAFLLERAEWVLTQAKNLALKTEIAQAQAEIERLYNDPPPDVQELIIKKLDLVSRDAVQKAQAEIERLKTELRDTTWQDHADRWQKEAIALRSRLDDARDWLDRLIDDVGTERAIAYEAATWLAANREGKPDVVREQVAEAKRCMESHNCAEKMGMFTLTPCLICAWLAANREDK